MEIPNKGVLTFDIKVLSVLQVTLFPCLHHYDDDDSGDDYMHDGIPIFTRVTVQIYQLQITR